MNERCGYTTSSIAFRFVSTVVSFNKKFNIRVCSGGMQGVQLTNGGMVPFVITEHGLDVSDSKMR